MKVEFIKEYEATTTTGKRTIAAGTVINLEEGKAHKLISAGIVKAVDEITFNPDALPYIDHRGRLVIPFDCPLKYRYWAGGQSVRETLKEIFEERSGGKNYSKEESAGIMAKYIEPERKEL